MDGIFKQEEYKVRIFEVLRKIFGENLVAEIPTLNDKILIHDTIHLRLIKDKKIIKEWTEKSHTITSAGKNRVRDYFITSTTSTPINQLVAAGTPYTTITPALYSLTGSWRCEGTFPASGAITNITAFKQQYSGTAYFNTGVTAFNKPDGVSLEVKITVTMS